jgi:uncharacterized protein YndB with AHSA1/START domain
MISKVIVALRVKATPERAFDAFVHEIGLWWRPNGLFRFTPGPAGRIAFEPGLGGRLTEADQHGRVFEIGRITSWAPGEKLAFTWRQASFAEDQFTEVEVRFEPLGTETRVTVEHRSWDRVPAEHVARHGFPETAFLARHAEWWRGFLASFSHAL